MDARFFSVSLRACVASVFLLAAPTASFAQRLAHPSAAVGSRNFVVFASSKAFAEEVAQAAEQYRRDLALHWLGKELPPWRQRCPLHVHDHRNAPASGETQFRFNRGSVVDWQMMVQGTRERIMDSVLPHEISHTVFATHFAPMNKYMPRWADEGACTTVEHEAEKRKHRHFLKEFLMTGRGLPFNLMFRLKEYPDDILPLYAQGHSAVQFLISQAGPRQFIKFVELGMASENWQQALNTIYSYESIGEFQVSWNQWLEDGSPIELTQYAPLLRDRGESPTALAANTPSGSIGLVSSTGEASSGTPVQFAVASRELPSNGQPASGAPLGWYSRRLTEITGEQPPKYNGRPQGSSSMPIAGGVAKTSRSARPSSPQSVQVQVQQWGQGGAVPGIGASHPHSDPHSLPAAPASNARQANQQPAPNHSAAGQGPVARTSGSRKLFGPPTGNWQY